MKESIGNALLYNIVIVFVIVFIGLFVTSLTYSKGYKVKNRMIEVIEKTYPMCSKSIEECNNEIADKIDEELNKIGYRGAPQGWNSNGCKERLGDKVEYFKASSRYQVCFGTVKNGSYVSYVVNSYMYLDFPLIGSNLQLPVRGETKTFLPGITS